MNATTVVTRNWRPLAAQMPKGQNATLCGLINGAPSLNFVSTRRPVWRRREGHHDVKWR
ncbi:hypothetical protein [Paraburkholderia sp.]|uniref:hypothetical protein n=1 Tax=Paraburkholderia sp. TaxID=1926495 RepID=UPI003C7DB07D